MPARLAVQMFTLREHTKTKADLADALARVAAMGYTAVQLSAIGCMNGDAPEVDAAAARALLDQHGLRCIATHRPWEKLVADPAGEIAFHKTLGCDFVAIGGIPGNYREKGLAGYRAFVQDGTPVLATLKQAGLRFGYHNHAHEFERSGVEAPRTLFDVFVDEADPALWLLEPDAYWIDHAGVNPERIFARIAGRCPVIHIKDKEMQGNDPRMAPIGEGNLDWDGLIPCFQKSGVEWIAIEQDQCFRDAFDCLRSAYDYLHGRFGLS